MRIGCIVILSLAMLALYILIVGEISLTTILLGSIASITASAIFCDILVKHSTKLVDIRRLGYLIKFFFHYLFVIEPRAHADLMKRILSPSMPVNPGIIAIPYRVESEYSVLLIANSITNTPGTAVVDIDKDKKVLFVHWIDIKAVEPEKCREIISRIFEEYSQKVFD